MNAVNTLASRTYWNPGITQAGQELGINLLTDKRQGYFLHDVDGSRLIDVHLNGGSLNLGYRNPELVETLTLATQRFDMGDQQLPSLAASALAEALAVAAPGDLQNTVYGTSSAEVRRIAINTARQTKPAGKIVSILGNAIESDMAEQDFIAVPYNDLKAMEDTLAKGDIAAVIIETIPQDNDFIMAGEGYLHTVKNLCERYNALYIADETQIGLMHTGQLWAISGYGIQPDILLIGNGLTGGMYPIACAIISRKYPSGLQQNESMYASGIELGCIVALKTLEICQRREVRDLAHHIGEFIGTELARMQSLYSDFFTAMHRHGLVMGLEFKSNDSAKAVMKQLYHHGILANISSYTSSVLSIKPGILMTQTLAEELLIRIEAAIFAAHQDSIASGNMTPSNLHSKIKNVG
ncbi:MAG: aminotransferase class III-fold pyridoxal phosphate-dependent enzyme [Pseudomonadales bacterium]